MKQSNIDLLTTPVVSQLSSSLIPEYKGDLFTRKLMCEIFGQYIFAHMATARNSGFLTPTVMFILRELDGEDDRPLAAPFNLNSYDEKELENIITIMLQEYPPTQYSLEMVMYARFKKDFLDLDVHDVWFGARDMRAASIHSIYTFHKKGDGGKFKHKRISPAFDQWVPHHKGVGLPFDAVQDPYLKTATEIYSVMATMALAYAKTK